MISLPKRLPYVKRLFKSFYQGIPVAYSEKVMRKVNMEWEASHSTPQKNRSSAAYDELKTMREENARLKKKLQDKDGNSEKTKTSKDERTCHLCRKTGHMIADCPDQCTTCSSPGKQVHKNKCECNDA